MFTKLPLGRKVALIILLSNGILLSAVFAVTGVWNVKTIRDSSIKIAHSTIGAFSQDFTKIIVFDSPHIAADTVSRLKAIDSIKNVILYNAQGAPVFEYASDPVLRINPPQVLSAQHYFSDGQLHVYSDVSYEGTSHGTVYYRIGTELLDSALRNFSISLVVFVVFILTVTFVLSFKLQKIISQPIVKLANVVDQVMNDNDLSKRVYTDEKNEIGQLYNNFNLMIEDLEKRNKVLEAKNKELELHRNELENLVEERTQEIKQYVKELETFSYSVSHDLRSPLRSINGFANMLMEKTDGELDEEGQQLLQRIMASSNRMGELIDDLLLLSRVNQCEIKKETFNLDDLIKDILEEHFDTLDGKEKIEQTMQSGIRIHADPRLMRIVLENLINNAFKYKSENKTLSLKIGVNTDAQSSVVYIEDNGIGFDMKYHDKIFNPFQRLHSNEEYEGTGIGLATVKRIMQRQNGDVWAKSVVQQGSTFYLKLPNNEI